MITLDTNVIARHLLHDIPDHAERATRLMESASQGDVELFIPATVFAELSYLLTRRLGIPRARVASSLQGVLRIPGIVAENEQAVTVALAFWASNGGLSFVDCYHLALTRAMGMTQIASFDKQMDRYPGVERIEP